MSKYNRWVYDYTENIDLTKIEWIKLNADELRDFYLENYLDKDVWQYVVDKSNASYFCSPLGLSYLSFDCNNGDYSYLLGIVDNNIGKKTIVAAMVYLENYYMFKEQNAPLTYISSIEVNSYFWNKGIYKRLCEEVIKYVNSNQYILLSSESDMGQKYKVASRFKEALLRNGFEKNIWEDSFSIYSESEFYNVICVPTKKLKKKID